MGELPSREPRHQPEASADARAMEEIFKGPGNLQSRYILVGNEWVTVIPGDGDYKRALPDRYDPEDGMPIPPWDPSYKTSLKKRPKQFRS